MAWGLKGDRKHHRRQANLLSHVRKEAQGMLLAATLVIFEQPDKEGARAEMRTRPDPSSTPLPFRCTDPMLETFENHDGSCTACKDAIGRSGRGRPIGAPTVPTSAAATSAWPLITAVTNRPIDRRDMRRGIPWI